MTKIKKREALASLFIFIYLLLAAAGRIAANLYTVAPCTGKPVFVDATGGRISEVCALNRNDIDFRTLEIKVLGKGNKERKVYMDTVTAMILQRYLDGRTNESPALFDGKGTTRLMPQGIRAILKRIGTAAGVTNMHPHRFRRTLATSLIDNGMTIQEVAHILGHERLDTTMKYVHVSDNNVSTNYQRYTRA